MDSSLARASWSPSRWKRTEGLANEFDQVENLLALLIAYRIAENAPQKPNVVLQRAIGLTVGSKVGSVGLFVHLFLRRFLYSPLLL